MKKQIPFPRRGSGVGLHKNGIRDIQDTRQIVDGKTNDIEIMTKKHKTTHEKRNLTLIKKQSTSSVRHLWTHGHNI